MEKHAERSHALLAASKSDRWLNCTPSARLEDEIPDSPQTDYAAEGELAHELAQLYLSLDILQSIDDKEFDNRFEEIINNKFFSEEMLDEVPKYVEYCEQALTKAKIDTPDAMIMVEQKVDFSRYVPEGFGTDDCIIIADNEMEVIDLKYGKGVLITAHDNSQLKLYAIGALERFGLLYDIHYVTMTIVQPRRDNVSSYRMSITDLYEWADTELITKAQLAFEGMGEQVAGDWCKFCKVKPQCRALANLSLEIARHDFKDAYLLTDDEISEVLQAATILKEWLNGIESYALQEALKGKTWPDFKLVAGVSRRKWADEDKVAGRLLAQQDLSEEDVYKQSLNAITTIEKKLGKKRFATLLSDLVIKPEGAPTLVGLDDNRPALGIDQAKFDFAD